MQRGKTGIQVSVVGFALLLLMAQPMEEFSPIDNNSIVDT